MAFSTRSFPYSMTNWFREILASVRRNTGILAEVDLENAAEDPHLVTLIEMRFFAGMTAEETADALNQSVHVVRHEIRYALAWLRRALDPTPES